MPARKKPPGTKQDKRPQRSSRDLVVVPPSGEVERKTPPPPDGLLVDSKKKWAKFWASTPASAVEDVDHVVAERWILAYDEWKRALGGVRRKRLVDGSMGQPVMNPLAAWVSSREAEMHKCETQLGIGIKERSALGISIGQAKLTAAELNRITQEEPRGSVEATVVEAEDDTLEGFEEA